MPLRVFLAGRIPIRTLALRTDLWILSFVSRDPFVSAPFATVSPQSNFWHSFILYLKGVYVKGPPNRLTLYVPRGNILLWKQEKRVVTKSPRPRSSARTAIFGKSPRKTASGRTSLTPPSTVPRLALAPTTNWARGVQTRLRGRNHDSTADHDQRRHGDGNDHLSPRVERAYNAAQTNEKARVSEMLRDLCGAIDNPIQKRGRPRLPLSDCAFCAVMKVYGGMSARRATSICATLQSADSSTRPRTITRLLTPWKTLTLRRFCGR
jgi:hypothetical protein